MALPKVVFHLPKQKWLLILPAFLLVVVLVLTGLYWQKSRGIELDLTSLLKKKPKPGDCLVLEQEHCRTGKPVYRDDKLAFVGFKLPQNTPIFAPFDGDFSNSPTFFVKRDEEYITYPGITVNVLNEDSRQPEKSFAAAYYDVERKSEGVNLQIERGSEVGRISEKTLPEYGDYNFLIRFSKFDQGIKMLSLDEEILAKLFRF